MADRQLKPADLLANPVNFLALGAGSGLSPVAPGTAGTIIAIPLFLLMPDSLWAYMSVLVVMFVAGVWICDRCANALGVHDHPGIVWDEIVGFLVTMILVPKTLLCVLLGFTLFRVFDVLKPWPVGWADKHVAGGLGIMIDDVIAGIIAGVCLQLLLWLVPGLMPG